MELLSDILYRVETLTEQMASGHLTYKITNQQSVDEDVWVPHTDEERAAASKKLWNEYERQRLAKRVTGTYAAGKALGIPALDLEREALEGIRELQASFSTGSEQRTSESSVAEEQLREIYNNSRNKRLRKAAGRALGLKRMKMFFDSFSAYYRV